MANEVDTLEVKVEAQARGANSQLDRLVSNLQSVNAALQGTENGGLISLANGVSQLGSAMQTMSNFKTTDFTRLAKGIQSLGGINSANLSSAASSINVFVSSMNGITEVSGNATSVGELAKNISKLGNKSVITAIQNIPQLSSALKQMMQTLSGAPAVSENIIKMTSAMASLSANGSKVASTSKNISTGFKQYTESTRNAITGSRSLASVIGGLYSKYFTFVRAFKGFGSAIKSSMDYIEEYNYFNVVTGKIADEWDKDFSKYGYDSAEAYGNSFRDRLTGLMSKMSGYQINSDGTLTDTKASNLGLDITGLTNYSAGLMQVTNSLGLTGEASEATSKALTMLAGDMSSFRNTPMKEVMTNMQSGLIGQSRALYKYGIDITNATLANYALANGVSKSVSEMSQAEKMQLRMIAILDQSKVAYGDLANTINSPSNQLRMLQNNFVALARTIGEIFMPIVAKVLPYINGLVIAIRRLFSWVASLLGVDLSGIISNSGAGYSSAFEDMSDDADDASNAIDGTKDSAKELKNELMGFDEVNKLSDNSSSSGSGKSKSKGGGAPIDLTDQLTDALKGYEDAWNKAFAGMNNTANKYADDICNFFKDVARYAEPSVDAVKRLWNEGLSKLRNFEYKACKDFLKDFLIPLGKWTLGKGFPSLVDAFNDFLMEIDWDLLNDDLDKFWKGIEPFAEGVGQGLIDFFRAMTGIGAVAINAIGKAIGLFEDSLSFLSPDQIRGAGEAFGILLGALMLFKGVVALQTGILALKAALFASGSGLFALLAAHPYIAIATGIVGVVAALSRLTDSRASVDVVKDINKAFDDTVGSAETEAKAMHSLSDEYFNLTGKAQLSNDERERAKDIAKKLVESYPELAQYYNNESGLLDTNKEKIDGIIESKLKEIKLKAYEDKLVELEKKKLEIQDKLNEAMKNSSSSLPGLNHEYQSLGDTLKYLSDTLTGKSLTSAFDMSEYEKELRDVEAEINKTQNGYSELESAQNSAGESSSNVANRMKSEMASVSDAAQTASLVIASSVHTSTENSFSDVLRFYSNTNSTLMQLGTTGANSGNALSTNFMAMTSGLPGYNSGIFQQIHDIAQNGGFNTGNDSGTSLVDQYKSHVDGVPNTTAVAFLGIMDAVNAGKIGIDKADDLMDNLAAEIGTKKWAVHEAFTNALSGSYKAHLSGDDSGSVGDPMSSGLNTMIQFRANGGPVNRGQMFIAREKGPELVGTMNGHTAVANNDQITQGITNAVAPAVYNAVVAAMSQGNGNSSVNVKLVGDTEKLFTVVQDKASDYTRQTGQPAFPV